MPKIEHRKVSDLAAMFQPRQYTEAELMDFHRKIQKFYDEPYTIDRPTNLAIHGKTARKFRYEDVHVAFGAARKVEKGKREDGSTIYAYLYNPERLDVFNNLWQQYVDYQNKQAWIEHQQAMDRARMAQEHVSEVEMGEVPF